MAHLALMERVLALYWAMIRISQLKFWYQLRLLMPSKQRFLGRLWPHVYCPSPSGANQLFLGIAHLWLACSRNSNSLLMCSLSIVWIWLMRRWHISLYTFHGFHGQRMLFLSGWLHLQFLAKYLQLMVVLFQPKVRINGHSYTKNSHCILVRVVDCPTCLPSIPH